jgi:predicted RNA-binding Zn ribbon-like protein
MSKSVMSEITWQLRGGRLCLDYANTADWHASDQPVERLTSYAEFVSWSRQAGVLTENQAKRLLRRAADRPEEARVVMNRAIALREAIYEIFAAVAHGQAPQATDLTALNAALSEMLTRSQIAPTETGFAWQWAGEQDTLDRPLWSVARSAADLLTSDELRRVGQCADDRGCGWLFLDTSRNHTRRWCSIKDCGNRAKAQRHYERKRSNVIGALAGQVI